MKITTHTHSFTPDTREGWAGGHVCVHCGFRIPAGALRKVGEWAYNPLCRENQRIIRAGFFGGLPYYQLPGYGTRSLQNARDDAPFVEFKQTSECTWARA